MTCFCGCDDFEKNPNGQFLACVKCGHGRQNHDDKFRESARANELHVLTIMNALKLSIDAGVSIFTILY